MHDTLVSTSAEVDLNTAMTHTDQQTAEDQSVPSDAHAASLQARAIRGAKAMLFRQAALTLLGVAGNVALARLLDPAGFGLYTIVGMAISFFNVVGVVGLGASLVQQPEEPSEEQLRSIFTVQQAAAILVVLGILTLSSLFASLYHLSTSGLWLLRALSASLLCASLRSVPGLLLDRRMEFSKVAFVDTIQAAGYTSIAVVLSLAGFGVWGLSLATIISSLIGLIVAYSFVRWRPALGWNMDLIRHSLRFGICFQGTYAVSLLKDSINPLLVGRIAGMTAVGYVNWAGQVAIYPIIVVSAINKVTFPMFARLQSSKTRFCESLELFIRFNSLVSYGIAAPIVALAPSISVVIFGPKWLPAVPMLYLFAFAVLWVGPGLPISNAMSAIGRSDTMFRFSILWAALTWIVGMPLVLIWGGIGYGIANAIIQFSNLLLYRKLQVVYPYHLLKNIFTPGLSLLIAVGAGEVMIRLQPPTALPSLLASATAIVAVYVGSAWLCWRNTILTDVQTVRKALIANE